MRREFVLVLLLLGCRPPEKSDEQGAGPAKAPAEVPRPAMQACAADSDCRVISEIGPNPDDPCCDMTMAGVAVRKDYVNWHFKYRKQHCTKKCPPLMVPGPPTLACGKEARCKQGTCANACPDAPGS